MAKPFLLTYPDKSRKHITRIERDSLLLSNLIRESGPKQYQYTGEVHTYHAFAEMGDLKTCLIVKEFPHYLRGTFVFETPNRPERPRRRIFERMETPESLAIRVTKQMQEATA